MNTKKPVPCLPGRGVLANPEHEHEHEHGPGDGMSRPGEAVFNDLREEERGEWTWPQHPSIHLSVYSTNIYVPRPPLGPGGAAIKAQVALPEAAVGWSQEAGSSEENRLEALGGKKPGVGHD